MTARQIRLAPAFFVAVCAGQILAQTTAQVPATSSQTAQSAASSQSGSTDHSVTEDEQSSQEQVQQPQYAPALDGSGLISMSTIPRMQLLMGGSVSSGFDTNPENLSGGKSSVIFSFSPYVSAQSNTGRTQLVLQYQPTIIRYTNYAGNTMQVASARADHRISEQLKWTMSVSGSHGTDSIRLLSPAQTVTIGEVPGAGPSSASYLPNAGTVTDLDGGLGFEYESTPRNAVSLKFGNSYDTLSSSQQKSAVATANVKVSHEVTPLLSVFAFQQDSKYYLDLSCVAFGGGAGMLWRPREGTVLSLQGGPQLNTPGCKSQQGFAYGVSFSTKTPGRAQLYFTSDRQAVTGYLGPGLFQNDVSGGYERQFRYFNVLALDVGYVRSSTLVNYSSYRGTYFDSTFGRTLTRGISLRCGYRHYSANLGNTSFGRDLVSVSMNWTPNSPTLSR